MGCSTSSIDGTKPAEEPNRISPPRDENGRVDLLRLLSKTDPGSLVLGCESNVVQDTFADKVVENRGSCCQNDMPQKVGFACKKGMKAKANTPNQDNFLILRAGNIGCYGVFDGHGEHGHSVSSFVAPRVVQHFACDPKFKENPQNALRKAFSMANDDLIQRTATRKHMDCSLSGTTATLMIDLLSNNGEREFCIAHCGDSRAVLGYSSNNALMATDLTIDHKPTLETEHDRIIAAGGAVRINNGDPHGRVFVMNTMHPGLAMSRAIGDTVAQSIGVICEPDVCVLKVQDNWRFVLLCSDGVWEFMSSEEAVNFVGQYMDKDKEAAANALALEAKTRWLNNEGNLVDDITVICIWLDQEGKL